MALADTIERLQSDRELGPNFAAWHRIPPVPPDIAPFPPSLEPRLAEALSRRGIGRLYTHQAEAVGAALGGRVKERPATRPRSCRC